VAGGAGAVSKSARLALECASPELRAPCRPGQRWRCVLDENRRWRKHKCKPHHLFYQPPQPHPQPFSHAGVAQLQRLAAPAALYQKPVVGVGVSPLGPPPPPAGAALAAHALPPSRRMCTCVTPSGRQYVRPLPDERKLQRQFLREHASRDLKEFRPRFLLRARRQLQHQHEQRQKQAQQLQQLERRRDGVVRRFRQLRARLRRDLAPPPGDGDDDAPSTPAPTPGLDPAALERTPAPQVSEGA
ncbi:Uncharacterized protein GBIM_06241, partial [Gryllus bimaculatus]